MTTVLDPKRSNAINIGLTTLPPVHVIKAALLNFDEFAVSKDGIEVGIHSEGCGELGPLLWLVATSCPSSGGHGLGISAEQSSDSGTAPDVEMPQDRPEFLSSIPWTVP